MAYEKNREKMLEWWESERYKTSDRLVALRDAAQTPEERFFATEEFYGDCMAEFDPIALWEDGNVPGFNPEYPPHRKPQIAFFPGEGGQKRGCIIVAPGGGYNFKSWSSEGFPVIKRLTDAGYSAVMLDYRVKPYTQHWSLIDMQRAIRLLKFKADELNIKADKIAVCGGSAGGNLSCLASVHFDAGDENAADPVERMISRPDAAIVSYGCFSYVSHPKLEAMIKTQDGDITPEGGSTLQNSYTDPILKNNYFFSPEKHVTPETPPFFLWQTCDTDDPRQMFTFAKELADAGVRFEAHIFPFGPHGVALADGISSYLGYKNDHVARWMDMAIEWLEINEF